MKQVVTNAMKRMFPALICILVSFYVISSYAIPLKKLNSDVLSHTDAAAFALLAYKDEYNNPPIPDGFSLLCECPLEFRNKDYYGEAYYRLEYATYSDGHKVPVGVTIVVAHRGTVINSDNLLDDLNIALKIMPDSFLISSKPFTEYVRNLAYSKFPYDDGFHIHNFIHVGHSLGAIHAELNYVNQRNVDAVFDVKAITFESPGSKEIIRSLISAGIFNKQAINWAQSITIFNTDVNAINSFNEQAGFPVLWIRPGYHFLNIPRINIPPIDFKYFLTMFTLDQHSMLNIYQFFKNGGQIDDAGSFPVGINNAYKYYITYFPSLDNKHHDYWDAALKNYWDHHNEIHKDYADNYDNYHDYMVRHHLT